MTCSSARWDGVCQGPSTHTYVHVHTFVQCSPLEAPCIPTPEEGVGLGDRESVSSWKLEAEGVSF